MEEQKAPTANSSTLTSDPQIPVSLSTDPNTQSPTTPPMPIAESQVITSPPVPKSNPPDGEASKKPLITIAIVVALLVIVAAAVFAYSQFNKSTNQMVEPSLTPVAILLESPTPEPKIDTSRWNDVSVNDWSFQIPSDWDYFTCKNNDAYVSLDTTKVLSEQIAVNNHTAECNFDYAGLVTISKTSDKVTIPTSPEVIPTPDPNSPVGEASNFYTLVSNKRTITIDGNTAVYQKEEQHGGQGSGVYYRVYTTVDSETYVFVLKDETQKEVFDQILSTFKFTN